MKGNLDFSAKETFGEVLIRELESSENVNESLERVIEEVRCEFEKRGLCFDEWAEEGFNIMSMNEFLPFFGITFRLVFIDNLVRIKRTQE